MIVVYGMIILHIDRSKWGFSGSPEWKRCWVWDACVRSGHTFLFSWSDSPVPDCFHPGADCTSGEGILPGELRVQASEMRTGGGSESTWDYNQGRPECPRRAPINLTCNCFRQVCITCTCNLSINKETREKECLNTREDLDYYKNYYYNHYNSYYYHTK